MLIQDIDLTKQITNRGIKDDILRVYYGIVPCDGKTRSISNLIENAAKYSEMAESIERKRNVKNK